MPAGRLASTRGDKDLVRLAGSYLRSLQLAKQLEERAKEATKNREFAEKEHEALQQFIKACKEEDVDLSEVQSILAEFEASMASKDYNTARANVKKASDAAKTAYIKKIGEVGDSVDSLLALGGVPATASKGALDLLEKSKDLVVRDDVEGAMKCAKTAYDAAERALHEHFSGLLSQAQEIIIQAKEIGEDVSVYEDQLLRAKTAIEEQEYETSAALIKDALDGAGDNVRSQVGASVSRAEEIIIAGEELGTDMTRVKAHVDRAKNSLNQMRIKEALSYAKRATSDGENVISSKFQDLSREIRDGIRKLKGANEDTTGPQDLLDQAQVAMKEKKFIETLRALTLAKAKIDKTQFDSVLDVISKARDKFVLAKKVGIDMTKAIALLNTSRDNLKLGKFEDALKYAVQSQDEIEKSLTVFYKARDDLVELAKAVKFTTDLRMDPSVLKAAMTNAKRSFEANEYADAAQIIKDALAGSRKTTYEHAMEIVNSADNAVKLGKALGADITEAEGVLHKALEALSSENIQDGVGFARSSLEAATASTSRLLTDRLNRLDLFIKGYSGTADLSEINEIIAGSRAHVAASEFDRANDKLKEITQKIEKVGQEESERLMGTAATRLADISSMGGDISDLEILMKMAKDALDQRVYEDASGRAKEIVANADEQMMKLIQMEFSSIKDSIEEAKTIGIDIEDAKTGLKEARMKADSKDLMEAHRVIVGTKEKIKEQIAKHDRIKEKINKVEELITEAAKSRADVSASLKKLDGAKSVFANGDLDGSEKTLDGLIDETERNLAMYLAAKFILSTKETIDLATQNDIDASPAEALLAQSKDLMKKKSYEEALARAKNADEEVRRIVSAAVGLMIKDLQRLLVDAKNVGVDTVGPEKLAEKAADLNGQEDFAEALKCIGAAKDDIDHVKNLSSQAAAEIRTARSNLRDAETLDMEVGRARELLDQAVDALTRHQYAIALELSRKSSEASSEVSRNRIWETLEKFRERIEKASTEGAPIGMAERFVADGVQAFRDGRYQDALKLAMQCEAEMDRAELQRDISTRAVQNVRSKMEEAGAEGIMSPKLAELVDTAETLLSKGRFVDALTTAMESGDELHQLRENIDSVRIEFSGVKEQVERLRKVKIDTAECDEILDIAQGFLNGHEFAKCRDALRRCTEKAASLFESSMSDVVKRNEELISRARAMGINTKPCEDLLEVAKTSFSEKLWDFAYQQAQACTNACLELIGKKMSSLIGDVRERTDVLSRMGAAVTPVEDLLEEAQKASDCGIAEKAFEAVMNAEQKLLQIEDTHRKYMDISIAAESAIETLAAFGIPAKESERLLALADIEKDKDYDSAIEFVAEALDSAKALMESYSPDISGTITSSGLQEGSEGEISVKLSNTGRALAKDIELDVVGDFEILGTETVEALRPASEETVKVKVVPKRSGNVPVRVKVSTKRHFDGRVQTTDIEDALNVYPAGPPFRIDRAADVARCVSCQGRIKPGFDIVSCRCGSQLHLACAKRTAQCPVCGQKYSF